MAQSPDALDQTISFLAKREGIDKTLKILRYGARFALSISPAGSEAAERLDKFQSSLGVSRKAYRLGKFLQNVNSLRQLKLQNELAYLELVGNVGEGLYYFIEQFTWLVKAGVLPKPLEKKFSYASAWCEMIGYLANITVNLNKIRRLQKLEADVKQQLCKAGKDGEDVAALQKQLASVRYQRVMRCAFVVQDCCDAILALSDIRGTKDILAHPSVLAVGGLVSAFVSTYKYWRA